MAKRKRKKKAAKKKAAKKKALQKADDGTIEVGPGEGYALAGLAPDYQCLAGPSLKRRLRELWALPYSVVEILQKDPLVSLQDMALLRLLTDVAIRGDFPKFMFVVDVLYSGGRVTGFDLGEDEGDDVPENASLVQMVKLPLNGSENMEYVSLEPKKRGRK